MQLELSEASTEAEVSQGKVQKDVEWEPQTMTVQVSLQALSKCLYVFGCVDLGYSRISESSERG